MLKRYEDEHTCYRTPSMLEAPQLRSRPHTRSLLTPFVTLFLLGWFCALIQIPLGLHAAGFGAGFESSSVAQHLAATGEFRDPFSIPTGPTAHLAPVYPAVLALVMKTFGSSQTTVVILLLLNALLLGVGTGMLPVLSRQFYGSPAPGVFGGILLAFCGRATPQGEAALCAVLLAVATMAILRRGPANSGLWAGAAILSNPVSLLPLAFLSMGRGKRFLAIGALVASGVCAPWILRNWAVLGTPFFIRDNFGIELYLANNDESQPELAENTSLWHMHPTHSPIEAARVAAQGEGRYNKAKLSAAMNWIRVHPGRFVQLCAARAYYYWFPSSRQGWQSYGYRLVSLLAIAGIWLSRKNPLSLTLAGAAIIYSLPYIVIQSDVRYGFPMLWALALPAGYAINARIALVARFWSR